MTEELKLLLTLAVSFIGSGLGTTVVGAFFKRAFDAQLETHKALLQRSSRVHERQVRALLQIHSNLEHALFYLQRAASTGKLEGEAPDLELLRRMAVDLGSASEDFSKNKLLMSGVLTRKLDEFFSKMFSAGVDLNYALNPLTPDGEFRADHWNKAKEIAYKELPSLLAAC